MHTSAQGKKNRKTETTGDQSYNKEKNAGNKKLRVEVCNKFEKHVPDAKTCNECEKPDNESKKTKKNGRETKKTSNNHAKEHDI
jgi:hypothetical protein